MKTVSTGLATLFTSSNEYVMADCYTFTLTNGSIYKFTSFDVDLTYGLNTWLSTCPVLERTSVRTVIGFEVGTLNIKISPKDTDMIGSQTWMQAACSGALDGALVSLDRAFMAAGTTTVSGTVSIFVGYVAQLSLDRFQIDMTVNTPLDVLSVQMPRNLYQPGCTHTLYDGGCSVVKASFTKTGTVNGSISTSGFGATITGAVTGSLSLGVLQFTGGVLTGTKRTIKSWDGINIVLLNPLPTVPATSDPFTAAYGCDKQLTTCTNTFANQANFKGFPFVPVPETAL